MTPQIKNKLDELYEKYNTVDFIENDPVSIPHLFTKANDIEVAALLASSIAWGQRVTILASLRNMMERMDMSPYDFVKNATPAEVKIACKGFIYRTFNEVDFEYYLTSLCDIYKDSSLRQICEDAYAQTHDIRIVYRVLRLRFFTVPAWPRTTRHMADIDNRSACKRLSMLFRWLVRVDDKGVDFGIWRGIDPSALYIPLDVHSARQARNMGLLKRTGDDWPAVEELTDELRIADPNDPAKYDFALFGLGVNKGAL